MLQRFTTSLFWDTDINKLSETEHAGFIIQRICMLGTWDDWHLLKEKYGLDKIKDELIKARYLDQKTLHYFSLVLDIPKENFRCYSIQQSAPRHWNY